MPTATLNGIDIYYELHGSGPRLLLLKGSGGTIAAAAPMIQKLAARFEVLIHDQRGLGRTTVPHGTPTMSDYAADDAALLDHLDWPSSLVFGTSFGGMVRCVGAANEQQSHRQSHRRQRTPRLPGWPRVRRAGP